MYTFLAAVFPVEEQDFLPAVSVGHEAFPVYRGQGFVPVLFSAGGFQEASPDAPVSQALS